jgi:YVTN family beta-propeller protein
MVRNTLISLTLIGLIGACTAQVATTSIANTGLSLKASSLIPVGIAPHGAAYSQGFVYVGNTGSASISVIDTATDTKVTDLNVGGVPSVTTATPDGRYVANVDTTGKVRIIDPAGGKHTILQTLDVGQGPDHAHFSDDGTQLAVSLTGENTVRRAHTRPFHRRNGCRHR